MPNWDSGQTQSLMSEFSGTESPNPDPQESQICLLGCGMGWFRTKYAKIVLAQNPRALIEMAMEKKRTYLLPMDAVSEKLKQLVSSSGSGQLKQSKVSLNEET